MCINECLCSCTVLLHLMWLLLECRGSSDFKRISTSLSHFLELDRHPWIINSLQPIKPHCTTIKSLHYKGLRDVISLLCAITLMLRYSNRILFVNQGSGNNRVQQRHKSNLLCSVKPLQFYLLYLLWCSLLQSKSMLNWFCSSVGIKLWKTHQKGEVKNITNKKQMGGDHEKWH